MEALSARRTETFSYRFFERIPADTLIKLRDTAGRVITDRARQGDLFSTPATLDPIPEIPVRTPPAVPGLAEILSPSQVRNFQDCQARWWYKYGQKIPETMTSARALGIAVHEALAFNFAQKIESRKDLGPEEVVYIFGQRWDDITKWTEFRADESPAEMKAKGEALVRLYMTARAPQVQPAAVEVAVDGEIAGVKVRGKVDVIDEAGAINDVKTACKKPSSIDGSYRSQVATYSQLAPGASGLVRLDTIVKTKVPQLVSQEWRIDASDLHGIETLYPLAQAAMLKGYYMPNRQSTLCSRRQCSYWRHCQADYGGTVEES